VDTIDEAKLARVASRTMRLWLTLTSGDARLAAAWMLGTALDWSLDLGLEAKDVTSILFTRVSAYLRTQPNGKARPP